MSHIVREKPWGVIDIVVNEGRIFFQERWRYNFIQGGGLTPWSLAEKQKFHRSVDTQIWKLWSNHVRFKTAGTASFAHKHKTVPINFDVRWVTHDEHWTVNVRKMPPGSTPTSFISNVDRANMVINLDSADLDSYEPSNAAGQTRKFLAVPHEFGHTFPAVDDEYVAGAPQLADTDSIMNIGSSVRERHLRPILDELNTMIPDCTFFM